MSSEFNHSAPANRGHVTPSAGLDRRILPKLRRSPGSRVLQRTDGSNNLASGFTQYSCDLKRGEESSSTTSMRSPFMNRAPHQTGVDYWLRQRGTRISQITPVGAKVIRASPLSECLRPRSMRRVPKPWPVGGLTVGPPLSTHLSSSS